MLAQQVRDALRHLHDRTRLQTHPLARFVGPESEKRAAGRGKMLQESLLAAIEAMRPAPDVQADAPAGRTYHLLVLRYVEGREAGEVQSQLAISKTEYYVEHQRAVEAVTSLLWERWQPEAAAEPAPLAARKVPEPAAPPADDPRLTRGGEERRRHNLPAPLTSLVGREEEIVEVERLLNTHRLVTLTGTGGCGKTRLALQVAAELVDHFPDGVWLGELAPLADPSLVARTVATALGVQEQPDCPLLETLVDVLRAKRLLLILDNCEHLIAICATLTDVLLRGCPSLQILATSRELLGMAGEVAWRVPSLPIPPQGRLPADLRDPTALTRFDSVRLFVERALLVDPGFLATEQNAPALAQICWRLDGMPLAIELAAARVRVLTVEQIATRLDDRFNLLSGGRPTAPRRHQTLRALIDWSHHLLAEPERRLLRRLAVFTGGWTLEAAEGVCAGDGVETGEVLDLLTGLVDKSLVLVETDAGEKRYRFLETIRHFAQETLEDAGETAAVRDRHVDWYLALVERAAPELWGKDPAPW